MQFEKFRGIVLAALFCVAGAARMLAAPANLADAEKPLPADLSVAVVEQIMRDHPTPASLGKWGYTRGLTLYGVERVYRRTHNPRYLAYIEAWAKSHVDADGKIDTPIDALDDMMPGLLMLALFEDTGDQRYRLAAQAIRKRFDTYPRTADGGLWHGAGTEHQHELWLDGMYMSMPFLVRYGEMFREQKYAYREASKQLLLYAKHLNDPATGLLFHAYDETGEPVWSHNAEKRSSYFWARSIGWYGVTLVEVLEHMPANSPKRPKLIALVQQLARAMERYQDPKSGLWFNVVDKGTDPENWLETSASTMYVYMISRAVERGYIEKKYETVACAGYRGTRAKLFASPEGGVSIRDICAGTVVGDLSYYLHRPQNTNDIHGTGQFLLMNEQMRGKPCAAR